MSTPYLNTPTQRTNIAGNFFIWLSGAQPGILARFPADRPKYIGIGFAVLFTASVAAVSMTFALNSALKISLGAAIPFAIAWGAGIMGLDRWLVVSLVRQRNKWSYLILAVPRLLLAILFGLIISTPITLRIFQPEIEQQITKIQQARAQSYYKSQNGSALSQKIATDQARVNSDKAIIASNGNAGQASQDTLLASLKQQRDQAETQATTDLNKWHCEVYGFPGHCVVGNGPAAQIDHQAYENDEAQVSSLTAKINDRETQDATSAAAGAAKNLANAEKDLGPAQAQLATDKQVQNNLDTAFNTTNASNAGLLLRLQALSQAAAANGGLQSARWVLFLFFTAIECLPVMVKVLLNLGPENRYEQALGQAERVSLRLAEQETMRQYREDIMAGDVLNEENERLYAEWRENVLPGIIRDATAARERIAQERLRAWERDARSGRAGGTPNGWTGPGGLSGTGRMPPTDWTATQAGARRPFSADGPDARGRARRPRQTPATSRMRMAWRAFRGSGTRRPGQPTQPPASDWQNG